ncbi:serine/threonine protein kinase [Trichodesmium erythraeum IMS101]|uniref:Serine/threonine protein kinase n=1 Tax=Trichodesmium erythraeum (strain IMS101) TaxID=203124 RepID=Q119A4_TRIEI
MLSGTTLRNRYKIIKPLGSGGFGDTYLAQDSDLPGKPKCVVKHLSPKSSDPMVLSIARKLFEREAEALYRLGTDSDQIPRLLAHFQEEKEFYLVQEYIEGQNISQELAPGKKLSESDTIALLKGILEALVVTHENNIIHRDIKPQNLVRRGSDNKVILIDFGAVKEISTLTIAPQGATTLTVAVGTPGYIPSEQSNGKPKLSSDIYAVGMVGIKALTGKDPQNLPTDPNTGNIIWRNEAEVSNGLANVLDKMVRDHFSERYKNAMEAMEALNVQTSAGEAMEALNIQTSGKLRLGNKTRRQILTLVGLAGSGFVGAFLNEKLKPSPENFSGSELITGTSRENISIPPLPKISVQIFTTVKVNRRGEIISRTPAQAEVITENIGDRVSLEMVKIPGGRFLMGSPETEAERKNDESPQHDVDVPEFLMGKYAVTQAQWKAVMGNNPARFQGANRPVEQVSWSDATEFCRKLSQITGKQYSLPSESQWEYACRAGATTPFYFGETITSELVNYNGNGAYADAPRGKYRQETTDVGNFSPNAFGLYDMHGNVWEFCQDVWHDNYNGAPTDGSAWETGGNSSRRVCRGGSWIIYPGRCRSADRIGFGSVVPNLNAIGFRLVSFPPRTSTT